VFSSKTEEKVNKIFVVAIALLLVANIISQTVIYFKHKGEQRESHSLQR